MLRRISFELRYRFGHPRWDTGITPPELVKFVEHAAPGRALDLGCGTGTNVVYLARHGWNATGVDFAPKAIALAKRRVRDAGVRATVMVADVTQLPPLGAPFDLALDIGCLHAVPRERRADYARGLLARLAPGATYLLYSFCPPDRYGIARNEVERLFVPLALAEFTEGMGRPSAWYRFVRRA